MEDEKKNKNDVAMHTNINGLIITKNFFYRLSRSTGGKKTIVNSNKLATYQPIIRIEAK